MVERVEGEAGYLLHSRPYRESSQLVDLFTLNHGRVRAVAKATRQRSKRGASSALLPFCCYQLSWRGRGELKSLVRAEALEPGRFLREQALFSGLYLNELIFRLVHEHDPHPQLYSCYQQLLGQFGYGAAAQPLDEAQLRLAGIVLQRAGRTGTDAAQAERAGIGIDTHRAQRSRGRKGYRLRHSGQRRLALQVLEREL